MTKFEKILVPTDFSELAGNAAEYAISIAQKYGSRIYLVHVIKLPYDGDFGFTYDAQRKEINTAAQKRIDESLTYIRSKKLEADGVLISGEPFVEIIKYAKQENIDLIVMATHGHTGIEHMLLGSVAEKVVRKAPCSVLTVKKSGQTFSLP